VTNKTRPKADARTVAMRVKLDFIIDNSRVRLYRKRLIGGNRKLGFYKDFLGFPDTESEVDPSFELPKSETHVSK
jgi:hypothetical protein